ncbi:MAG TPA: retropepsin-like aspartic protease [Terracidiphilus sp.]|nr:retropepsin-like aspartic protease [Terracidiphilus sp.]
MATFKWFAPFVLAATIIEPLSAETHCPGSVASVPLHLVNRYQMIVAVSLNKSGPYNFLLDTGTEITMIDVSLAGELHMETHGAAVVAGAGFQVAASFSQLDQIAAGSQIVSNQKVLVYDLQKLKSADLQIQGILGEDFLEHFDVLIDNAHNRLCLEDTGAMRTAVKGTRVPQLTQASATDSAA